MTFATNDIPSPASLPNPPIITTAQGDTGVGRREKQNDTIKVISAGTTALAPPSSFHPISSSSFPLQRYLIPDLPASAYYIPSFITSAEEAQLQSHILSAPRHKWTTLSHRRLQSYPSALVTPSSATSVSEGGPVLLDSPLPSWMDGIVNRIVNLGVFANTKHQRPNHVLVNEYLPGQGILWHEDGGAYEGVVATVTTGSYGVLNVKRKNSESETESSSGGGERLKEKEEESGRWRVLQERGSLLVSTEEVYGRCLHCIAEVERDEGLDENGIVNWGLVERKSAFEGGEGVRGTRISLTFRDVKRVKKLGKAFKGLNV